MTKEIQLDNNGYRKFGLTDKLAYAAGDFGCCMSFALKSYMMIYWTQAMKMDSYLYAILLVICQVWDAINDQSSALLLTLIKENIDVTSSSPISGLVHLV